jgi:hypothetical protein
MYVAWLDVCYLYGGARLRLMACVMMVGCFSGTNSHGIGAGGGEVYQEPTGIARVNGKLGLSRSLGDVRFR